MQKHGTVGFAAIFAAAAAAAALSACSAAPDEATDSQHDSLGRIPSCSQEPIGDCRFAHPTNGYQWGYVVLTADERCAPFIVGRTIFTGTPGQQFLAETAPSLRPELIPRITAAMESGAQPFCLYRNDALTRPDLASYESSFCALSSTVDVLCMWGDPDQKPLCPKCDTQ